MKLLFDQNLSFKLCRQLSDLFPESSHVRLVGLSEATDRAVWNYAGPHGFVVVTNDSDFADLVGLLGSPPNVIWLRRGNQPTGIVEAMLRSHLDVIIAFEANSEAQTLEIY